MFTGIVEEVGAVAEATGSGLVIAAATVMDDLAVADSICVNGACLTVTAMDGQTFSVDTVPETLRRTNLGALSAGSPVNLERSMPANGRFGGHVVQGHVDGAGEIVSIAPEGEARNIAFRASPSIMRYVVEKGFVAVDGTSLTVVNCNESEFSVTIIPYTWENTVFHSRRLGDTVNLEADIFAKYVARSVEPLAAAPRGAFDHDNEL